MRLNDSAMLTVIAGYLPIDNVTALDLCSGGVGVDRSPAQEVHLGANLCRGSFFQPSV